MGAIGQKTRIDAFLLDEGFGSLAPDSLDVALDALDSLNAQGKVIGVISDVDAVKERIPVQIQMRKRGGRGLARWSAFEAKMARSSRRT